MTAVPRWLKPLNTVLLALQRIGIGTSMPVLTLPGRRTGQPRRTPLSILDLDGQRYLLAGYPGADWAANARAAGTGTLTVGRRTETVRLVEVPHDEALPVLREWPVRIPQGATIMKNAGVVRATTPEAFEEVVGVCAVFRLEAP